MAVDELTYPAPVLNRAGPGPSSPPAPVSSTPSLPRTRVFPVAINEVANRRSAAATPILRGPVIVLDFSISAGTFSEPVSESFEIGWAPTVVTETAVLLTVPKPYTVLTELLDPQGLVGADRGDGFPLNIIRSPETKRVIPLGLIVDAPEVSIVVAVVNPSGHIQTFYGHFRVIENVSREALANFR